MNSLLVLHFRHNGGIGDIVLCNKGRGRQDTPRLLLTTVGAAAATVPLVRRGRVVSSNVRHNSVVGDIAIDGVIILGDKI